jgi:cytochrome bd-type quinol oxidase subunit 2
MEKDVHRPLLFWHRTHLLCVPYHGHVGNDLHLDHGLGSTFLLFGLLMTGAAALFPVVLFSTTDPNLRLTAADCAAPDFSLGIAAAWWFPALILAICYLCIIQRHYSGKVNVSKDSQGLY